MSALLTIISPLLGGLVGIGSRYLEAQILKDKSAWDALAESHKPETFPVLPPGVWTWVSSLLVLTEAVRRIVRPALCFASVYMLMQFHASLTDPQQRSQFIENAQFGCWTVIYWWVGSRFTPVRK